MSRPVPPLERGPDLPVRKIGLKKQTKSEKFGIEKVTLFRTADGTTHDTYAAALSHTSYHMLAQWLKHWLETHPLKRTAGELELSAALALALRKDWVLSKRGETDEQSPVG